MAKYNVSFNQIDPAGINMSVTVEAPDPFTAMKLGTDAMRKNLAASGLVLKPAAPAAGDETTT